MLPSQLDQQSGLYMKTPQNGQGQNGNSLQQQCNVQQFINIQIGSQH